jgi:hypothetical protein
MNDQAPRHTMTIPTWLYTDIEQYAVRQGLTIDTVVASMLKLG